jgi:hypothetical protein
VESVAVVLAALGASTTITWRAPSTVASCFTSSGLIAVVAEP